jgi:hypothetical protein
MTAVWQMASYFRGQATTKGFLPQWTPCDAGAVAGFTDLVYWLWTYSRYVFSMEVSGLLRNWNYFRRKATAITDNTKKNRNHNRAEQLSLTMPSGSNTGDQSLSASGRVMMKLQQLLVQKSHMMLRFSYSRSWCYYWWYSCVQIKNM